MLESGPILARGAGFHYSCLPERLSFLCVGREGVSFLLNRTVYAEEEPPPLSSDLAPVETEEEEEEEPKERHCDSLIMCIVTTLNEGLRNGGGIGDVLRKPSRTVSVTPCTVWRQLLGSFAEREQSEETTEKSDAQRRLGLVPGTLNGNSFRTCER